MTTEVAILNKSAVALAADSAVTITRQGPDDRTTTKIYVDANKLFELIKGVPVGVMIYNSAEVGGIPWETLVKVFRAQNRLGRFATLQEYVDGFLEFVEKRILGEVGPAGEADLRHYVLQQIFSQIYDVLAPRLRAEPTKLKRRAMFSDALEQITAQFDAQPIQEWADGLSEDALWRAWGTDVFEAIPTDLGEVKLSIPMRRQTAKLLIKVMLRYPGRLGGVWSGVVVAGFGEDEMFPSVYHCTVNGLVEGRLMRVGGSQNRIDSDQPAIIQPYAQTSEALMFLQGIDPSVSHGVSNFWAAWSKDVHNHLIEIVRAEAPSVTPAELKEIRKVARGFMAASWDNFADYMNAEFHQKRMEPIEASAAFLSKREIADLAENLVELTSLRNRVSLDRQETVGGATDVAVISKGDGFVWVKRKHYFEQGHNPNWGLQQAVADVVSKLGRGSAEARGRLE